VAATGLVKNANSVWLNGKPLGKDVEAVLDRPVRFANDANCFVLSEAVDGAAAGCGAVFGVILGTGVGGGIVVGGRIIVGANAIAGEWGHNPLPAPQPDEWPGPPCYCGRSGCIETFLSGPGLAADHQRHGGAVFDGVTRARPRLRMPSRRTGTACCYRRRCDRHSAVSDRRRDRQASTSSQ
jgi:fructokinase